MTAGRNIKEGQYTLLSLTMSAANRLIDLSQYASRLDIYESILAGGVVCELAIADSTGIFHSFQHTNEELCVSFTTYEDIEPVHYRFNILSVNPAKSTPNDKMIVYVITACSPEILTAMTKKNIPLIQKKLEANKAIKAMLSNIESKKEFFTEKTAGLHTFNSANMNPFEFIHHAATLATSEKWKSSSFVFYENYLGYHLKTLEQLIYEGRDKIGDKFFVHSTLANLDAGGTVWRNIIGVRTIQAGNQNVTLLTDANNTQSIGFDIRTGYQDQATQKPGEVQNATLNNNSLNYSSAEVQKRSKDPGPARLSFVDASQENNQYFEKRARIASFISQFLTVGMHMVIYGDSAITIGDVIACRMPTNVGLTLGDTEAYVEDDPVKSGNYLVCKVRHILTFGESPRYYQALEVFKDGIGGDPVKSRFNENTKARIA